MLYSLLANIKIYMKKPTLYEKSTNEFWNDKHISKGMLENHLNPNNDGATRSHKFVEESVNWIYRKYPSNQYKKLLDLGCGPGIYTEKFYKLGYDVLGIDFSKRSIEYANGNANKNNYNVKYKYDNYLKFKFTEKYDIVTLIWCDYCALSPNDRNILLGNIYKSLSQNGVFIFDIFSNNVFEKLEENSYYKSNYYDSGFWNKDNYLLLEKTYLYENRTAVRQSVIVTEEKTDCYNIWEHYFTKEEIINELKNHGFSNFEFYGDIAGKSYSDKNDTICIIAKKKQN